MSLSAHLLSAEAHASLAFRRDCRICRGERLAGALPPGEPVVPARLKAGLVAAVLAGSAVAPAAAAAQDQGPPIELPPPSALDDLPEEEVPPGQDEAQPDPAEVLLGEEPGTDEGAPAEDEESPPPGQEPVPGEEPVPDSAPDVPGPAAPPPPPSAPPPAPAKKPRPHRVPRQRTAPPAPHHKAPVGPAAPAPTPAVQPAPSPSAPEPAPAPPPPPPNGHGYAVRSGDTLWSIARSLLGPGSSPAQIARKVDQLWRLNAERIRSGRPDLIQPGERLRLP
jgi:hypothetical protein